MEYETYTRFTGDAARRLAQGALRRASVILQGLLASEISDLDKAEVCSTMATINQKLQQDTRRWPGTMKVLPTSTRTGALR